MASRPWIRTFIPENYKLQHRGKHPIPYHSCHHYQSRRRRHWRRRHHRRHRPRCRSSRRCRWQIINIHYVLTKLSHKLCARGKNGTVDNG